eukprot:g26363.t1
MRVKRWFNPLLSSIPLLPTKHLPPSRSKEIESSGFNGTAAFMEVRVQSIVVEFILNHVEQLFDHKNLTPVPGIRQSQHGFVKEKTGLANLLELFEQ